MKKIIILDSGIDKQYACNLSINMVESKNFILTICNEDIWDLTGHGTAVCSIISTNNIDEEIEFIILKIYGKELVQEESILIRALDYCIQRKYSSCILHMSLGVNYYSKDLEDRCRDLYKNGNLIVSAFDNSGNISYPAAFDFVLGVEADDTCIKSTDFILPVDSVIKAFSKGGIHKVAWINGVKAIRQGSSMSAAYVSAALLKSHESIFTLSKAIAYLKDVSSVSQRFLVTNKKTGPVNGTLSDFRQFNVKRIALFPYNKEISSLVKFADQLTYELKAVYSSRYIGNVGNTVSTFANDQIYQIKDIKDIDFSTIDMLVIGHTLRLDLLTRQNAKESILKQCLENNVHVFCLDKYGLENFANDYAKKGLALSSPGMNLMLSKNHYGKLYKIKTPVLGIFGTSSVQGKFTTQLIMRKMFINNGYSVAQLSTEPTGILFGMDYDIPFGYAGNVELSDYEFIGYVNRSLHNLDMLDRDIIIAGCQSRSIPETFNHIGHMALRQIEFLLALQPDAVILCINPTDSIEYIHRTITSIENLTASKIISLVLYPFYYANGWQMINKKNQRLSTEQIKSAKEKYEIEFQLPCFVLNIEEDTDALFKCVLEFF